MVAASEGDLNSVYTEKRRSPRFPFVAEAEITEKGSSEKLVTRVSELSVNGCYIDEQNPFPSGTIVKLKIVSESEVFDATAKVLYAHRNLGMGLVFQDVSLRSGAVLREWLLAAKALEEKSHS
jgi:PilZ domain